MTKIIHLRNKCIGCGTCVMHAPDNWEMNCTDGKADLKNSKKAKNGFCIAEISEVETEVNKNAERDCPVGGIKVVD